MAKPIEIHVPDLGGTSQADVIEVLVKVGDKIAENQALITLESDKASMEIPASQAGVVKELKVKVGDKIGTGSVILLLEAAEGSATEARPEQKTSPSQEKSETKAAATPSQTAQTQAPAPTAQPVSQSVAQAETSSDAHLYASPAVRRLAHELDVNLQNITGTGPRQRIQLEDLYAYVKQRLKQAASGGGSALPAPPNVDFAKFGPVEHKPLTKIKKLTGQNLSRNWLLVPHVTQFNDADITDLEAFRKEQQTKLEAQGIKLTPLVFLMKAVVASLKAFPQFNASLSADGEQLILKQYFHIGVAVDTPDGLVVPVIRDVDQKGLVVLAQELGEVSKKARNKQLTTHDMQGSCFTISSLGGIGGTAFTPIVNLPDVAILGVSKAQMKPVYQNQTFVPRLMLPLSLSYDHRVIDGAEGARFIVYLTEQLADLRRLLL